LDTVAWPERNDIHLLKTMVGKAVGNTLQMEKKKRLQVVLLVISFTGKHYKRNICCLNLLLGCLYGSTEKGH
jgi:hypothetical protein